MSNNSSLDVRRLDIDGLRAIAALSITIFHIMPTRLPGGFVGVDVFFVISGYLILGNIYRRRAAGTFDLIGFYLARARRLFPALFFMMAGVLIFSWFALLPSETEQLGKSVASAALYVSNLFYLSQSGYFDAALQSDPMLHTWSLAVEEQLYLVAPIVLVLAVDRFSRWGTVATLLLAGLSSFALCVWLTWEAPSWAFYLAPTRAWEFVFGGVIAIAPMPALKAGWRNVAGLAGIALIVTALVLTNKTQPFPGMIALMPVLGTAAVIVAGSSGSNLAATGLSLRPAVWVGRASYSIYLWHWPIVVFYYLTIESNPSIAAQAGLLVASLGAGFASYLLIEQVGRRLLEDNRATVIASLVGTVAFVAVGGASIWTAGFAGRFSSEVGRYASYLKYDEDQLDIDRRCFIQSNERVTDFDPAACVRLSSERPNVLVVGDSQAAHYARALSEVFPEWSVSEIASSGCRPLLNGTGERRCTDMMRVAFSEYIGHGLFDAVIIAGRWRASEAEVLRHTVEFAALHTQQVIVFGPIIEYDVSLPRLLATTIRDRSDVALQRALRLVPTRATDDALRFALIDAPVHYYSIVSTICPDRSCVIETEDGIPLQHDYGHLTLEGARWLLTKLRTEGALLASKPRTSAP